MLSIQNQASTFHYSNLTSIPPSFGFVILGGALVGSLIRELRVANELADRGFHVHIFWAIDRSPWLELHPNIHEHWLFSAPRYNGILKNLLNLEKSSVEDRISIFLTQFFSPKFRALVYQQGFGKFDVVKWALNGLIRHVCRGVETDPKLLINFGRTIDRHKITHLLPSLAVLAPFCTSVQEYVDRPLKYLLTFQGYELYLNYARDANLDAELISRLKGAAHVSDFPSVVVSEDYGERVQRDIGLTREQLVVVPACITLPEQINISVAKNKLSRIFAGYNPKLPLLTYMGRQDAEKGIDLLLYASKILETSGLQFQLAVCGATSWGTAYKESIYRIADNLRLPLLKADYLSEEEKTALYRASHCVVYPPIHFEPFGMVPVEAMAQGTPVVVPDSGGVAELPFSNGYRAGLNFRSWDTADLAQQLSRLLKDSWLHSECSANARSIAERYSVGNIVDQILDLLGYGRSTG